MKHKLSLLIVLGLSMSLFSGCYREKSLETMSRPVPPYISTEAEDVFNNAQKKPDKFYSPYTGEEVDEKTYNNVPFMAIVENSSDARPQSGLNNADIVYETMAEGGIPRFIALFQKNSPEKIGPIRSARPYFVNIAREYNLPFAHCGYSDEAKLMIEKNNLMTLNEFIYSGFYWRDNERKAPHNLYTSAKRIRDVASSRNYIKPANVKLKFNKDFWNSDSHNNAKDITLKLNRYYTTSYSYHDGKYYKSMDGKDSVNKEDKAPIAVNNVVIQMTGIRLQKDNQHLDIDLVGEGTGYVFSNGKYTKMKWSKKDINSQTILKDENGIDIPLSPGNTWWNIIDKSNVVDIK